MGFPDSHTNQRTPPEIVFLPPVRWPDDAVEPSSDRIDRSILQRRLRSLGVRCRTINPTALWTSVSGPNGFWLGLDPLRAIRVLLTCRRATVVVSVFETPALVVLLLRRLVAFRPKVVLWDASVSNQ